jgi:hypothetical protein
MPREIDPKATAKALRKLKRAAKAAEEAGLVNDWEEEFLTSVEERLETFGSAFADPEKGPREEALSIRQQQVLARMRAEARKAKRQARKGDGEDDGDIRTPRHSSFKQKGFNKRKPPRVRQIDEDFEAAEEAAPAAHQPIERELPPEVARLTPKPTASKMVQATEPPPENSAESDSAAGGAQVIAFPGKRKAGGA